MYLLDQLQQISYKEFCVTLNNVNFSHFSLQLQSYLVFTNSLLHFEIPDYLDLFLSDSLQVLISQMFRELKQSTGQCAKNFLVYLVGFFFP